MKNAAFLGIMVLGMVSAGLGQTVSGMTPTSGPVGTSVTITGSGFGSAQNDSEVDFGTLAPPTSWNDTTIVVPVPSGATTGEVLVVVPGGRGSPAYNAGIFTVTPGINSLSPSSGPVGTSVTITGTSFGASQGSSTVTFNGVSAVPSSWSDTSIVVPVPSGAGAGNVVVTVNSQASNTVNFPVLPGITSLTPNTAAIGASVTFIGTSFGASQGSSVVRFRGARGFGGNPIATVTSWSDTSITATVPSGALTGNVTVTTSAGASAGVLFTLVPPPSIASISPTAGPVAASVTITGSNFGATQSGGTVTLNGTAATPTSWSDTQIVVPVPAGATTGNMVVTASGVGSNGLLFTVTDGVTPALNSLSPTSGAVGASVTITGTGFAPAQGSSIVTFNGTVAAPNTWTDTQIVVPVPSGATTGNVVVTVGGLSSNGLLFTATSPAITSLSPAAGGPGTNVVINGVNFGATQGSSSVTLGAGAITPTSWSNTSIGFTVPGIAGNLPVQVTVNGVASNAVNFNANPTITNVSPASGFIGSTVTITGTGFGQDPVVSFHTMNPFGSGNAFPKQASDTQVVVTVPLGVTTGNITVFNQLTAGGNAVLFTVNGPSISYTSPTSGSSGAMIEIWGSGFGSSQGTSTVTFNGTPATSFQTWSDSLIEPILPGDATSGNVVVTVGGQASPPGILFTVPINVNSVSPVSGVAGTSVTISGSGFGGTQGSSTVTFNGVIASPTSWSSTSIVVPVPSGATTGNLVVTVAGRTGNSTVFTIPSAVVQSNSGFATGTTNPTVSFPNSNTAGNLLWVAVGSSGTITAPTDTLGNTYTLATSATGSAGSGNAAIYYAASAKAGANTVTCNHSSSGDTHCHIAEITGLATASPLDQTGTVSSSAVCSVSSSGATLLPNEWVGAFFYDRSHNQALTQDSNYNQIQLSSNTAGDAALSEGRTVTSAGVQTATCGGNSSDPLTQLITTFKTLDSTPAPVISSLSPSSGPAGTSVTISGANFGNAPGSDTVTFNGIAASPISSSSTSIVAPVPNTATTGNVVVAVGGSVSNSVVYTVTTSITGVSPASGVTGTVVTISGSGFGATQGSSTVTFNGTAATPTSWSSTSIVVPVPAGASTGNVIVTVSGTVSNSVNFVVIPAIAGVSPSPAAVGTSVTINGSGFGATQGSSTVSFNGTVATPASWSTSAVVVPVPVGATSGNVVLIVGGNPSNTVSFAVAPGIISLSPTSGPVGTPVTITGTSFGAAQGNNLITFTNIGTVATSWSDTTIVAPVPCCPTSGNVYVSVGGNKSNVLPFTIVPAITSLSPSSGVVGTTVTINGTSFGSTQGTSTVTFNGTPATPTSWNTTKVVVTVPSGTTSGNVVVTVDGVASNPMPFSLAASLTVLSPTSGPVGNSITIVGSNFGGTQGASTVTFNGAVATPTSWSNTQIVAPVPTLATTGNVVVTIAGGSASNGLPFTVVPTITTLSPTSGPVGASITINGTGFEPAQGTSTIAFNGVTATPSSWSNTQIVAPLPSGATSGNVQVTVGGNVSNAVAFTVTPGITSLSPASGTTGTSVTITGTSFGASQGGSSVTFNGAPATPTSWGNTQIVVPVPAAASSGNVVVTVNLNPSVGVLFAVVPTITTVSPGKGATGASVTITGTGFGASPGTSTVTFNGTPGTPTSWSNTQIVVPVPNAATSGNVVVTVGGNASNGILFTVVPTISSLSPASGAVGTVVTVAGTGFGSTQGTSTITFNGTAATPVSWSNSAIVVQAPSGTTTGNVVVTVAGNASNGANFTLSAAPLVQSNSSFATSVTSTSVAFLANNTAGNLLWVAVGSGGTITPPTDTQGNSYVLAATAAGAGSSGNAAIYYAASAKGGANTVTCNQSSSADIHCHIAEITGFATGARLDQTGSVGSSSTCSVSTSGATNQANEWLGAFFFDGANNQALTAGNGYATLQLSSNGVADAGLSESQSVTSTGVQTATCGGNAADSLNQLITTFETRQVPAVALSSSVASSIFGSPVTLTATVSGNVGTPTGTVTFNDGATAIGSAPVSNGTATLTTNQLVAGTHSITASYGGDTNYAAGQSSAVIETVAQATASIALTSSVTGTATFGTPVTFTATVTPSVITGNMTFSDGSAPLGSAPITNGQAVLTTSDLSPGSHSITASLAGTSNFAGTTSTAVTTPVSVTGVTFTLNCVNGTTCGSSTYGDTVSINVAVTGKPKLPAPTGTVNISDCAGHTVGPDVGLSGGSATVTTNTLTPDIKSICGIYSPDAASSKFYFNDQSSPLAWVVNQAATTTALKSDATTDPIVTGTTVTFTATVTGVPNGATPTGTVTFNDTFNGSTTPLGTTNLSNGTAALATSKLQDGVHSIAAIYNGDKNYKTSTSSPLQQTLQTKPVVQSLSLLKGPPGIGLVVNGKNFGNGGATSKIEFKAADGTRTQLTLVGPGWTAQAITVQIPTTLKLGAGTIVVTVPDSAGNPVSSNELSFEVANPFGCP